jgi:hypothetical protein
LTFVHGVTLSGSSADQLNAECKKLNTTLQKLSHKNAELMKKFVSVEELNEKQSYTPKPRQSGMS